MDETSEHRYSLQQKISFTMLLLFGIIIVALGFLQMRNTIYGPFVIRASDLAGPETSGIFESEEVRLQSIDTDQDTINDYEELQFFGTSPYLPDTDSDGIQDKKEIDAGTDPLCPEGKQCARIETQASTTSQGLVPVLGEQSDIGKDPGAPPATDILGNLTSLSTNPATLRELMLRSGAISKEELNKVDDATLLLLAQNLITQQFGATTTSTTTTP